MAKTLDATYNYFLEWTMPQFAEKFPIRGENMCDAQAFAKFDTKILEHYSYTADREAFLIKQAKLFIEAVLPRNQSHNTSTAFLERLMNKIAAFLANYVMHKHQIPEGKKSKNKLRISVRDELKEVLFDKNPHILFLKQQQEKKRELRQKPKSERKKAIREERQQQAEAAYRTTRQVRGMYFDAQRTPRKKR